VEILLVVLVVILAIGALLAVVSAGDIRRYFRMRKM